MSSEKIRNSLSAIIKNVQGDAKQGAVVFRADTTLVYGMHCHARVRSFAPFSVDEPPVLGGSDKGPNPVELLLVALGTCQEIMFAAYASMMKIQLTKVQVKVRGYLDLHGLLALDDNVPAGYRKITFETHIESPADHDEIEKLVKMVETHCPVMDSLERAVEITGNVRLNGSELIH